MRGSDLGPSGPPPGEGRTNRGDSRLKRIVLLVGVLGAFVMLAVGAIFAGALVGIGSDAVAAPTPTMDFACALKSNGLLRYVTTRSYAPFVIYRVVLGVCTLVLAGTGVLTATPTS